MVEVRDFYDLCVSCNWEDWIISNDYLKLEIQTGKTGISHKQWQSLVQSLEACCWFISNIAHITNILLTCTQGGNECLQFMELALWSLYIRYCHIPHFLYIKKRYLQPPTKRTESTLPEQSVVQEDVLVSTNVPTNPLADLQCLRWNQYSLPPSPIHLKRAKRWLNSNKKRALRKTNKLKAGKCPDKRWWAE